MKQKLEAIMGELDPIEIPRGLDAQKALAREHGFRLWYLNYDQFKLEHHYHEREILFLNRRGASCESGCCVNRIHGILGCDCHDSCAVAVCFKVTWWGSLIFTGLHIIFCCDGRTYGKSPGLNPIPILKH